MSNFTGLVSDYFQLHTCTVCSSVCSGRLRVISVFLAFTQLGSRFYYLFETGVGLLKIVLRSSTRILSFRLPLLFIKIGDVSLSWTK